MDHPLLRRLAWVLFAAVFYTSGLAATTWLLEPERLDGLADTLWALAFPLLLPAFFRVNGRLGCAGGPCRQGRCAPPSKDEKGIPYPDRMPGL